MAAFGGALTFSAEWNANDTCTTRRNDTYCGQCEVHEVVEIDLTHSAMGEEQGCTTLWFAGMHELGSCKEDGTGYQNMYAAALNSAIINAGDSLQPVLMLGRLDMENSTTLSKFGTWAKEKGAIVITVPNLSFQDVVNQYYSHLGGDHRQGPWLRLEIPRLIKEYELLDKKPNICKEHVIYTDSDVIFANKISKADVKQLTDGLSSSGAVVSYGREGGKHPHIHNTGVMVIDVAKFADIIPGMINYLKANGDQGAFDQGLMNKYFRTHSATLGVHLLTIHYNWKVYWKVEPSSFEQVKVVHLHGPKPGRGLEAIAECDPTMEYPGAYDWYVRQGICCDEGRTASWAVKALEVLTPAPKDICE